MSARSGLQSSPTEHHTVPGAGRRAITVNNHSHANWAVEAADTYTLVFEVTATTSSGAAVSTGQKSYTVTVQP